MKAVLTTISACVVLLVSIPSAFTQTWTQTAAPTNLWSAIACSADGTKVVAASGVSIFSSAPNGVIYISTNSGANWMPTTAPAARWISVASSADGARLIAVATQGPVYTSADGGTTWASNKVPVLNWKSVASSADGSRLIAGTTGNQLFISTNSGANWSSNAAPGDGLDGAQAVASSADGLTLAVGGRDICISTNGGQTWITNVFSTSLFVGICSSADGTKLAAVNGPGGPAHIYTSSNSGATWTMNTNAPALNWLSIASSADGTKLVASAWYSSGISHGPVYTSSDSGVTWTSNNLQQITWMGVASSADGDTHFAAGAVSSAQGQVWMSQSTPAPELNISPADTNVLLSWIVPSTNFTLEQNPDLSTSDWTPVTNIPTLDFTNVQFEVTLPPTNSQNFFRLATP